MRTIRGFITPVRRREGRIGRIWRRVSRSTVPILTKREAASELNLAHGAASTTGQSE